MENLDIQGLARMISAGANLIYVQSDKERRTEAYCQPGCPAHQGDGRPLHLDLH